MEITKTKFEVTVPAGEYFLGDPCYAVPDEDWMPLLESCGYFAADKANPNGSPVGEVRGFKVLSFGTKWGDGVYPDQFGNAYPVDAGMIGLTPVGLIKDRDYANRLGQFVTFDRDTTCYDEDGILHFGKYRIDTVGDEEEGEWY